MFLDGEPICGAVTVRSNHLSSSALEQPRQRKAVVVVAATHGFTGAAGLAILSFPCLPRTDAMKASSLRPLLNGKGLILFLSVASVHDLYDELQSRGYDASTPPAELHGVHEPSHLRDPFTSPIGVVPGDIAS